MLLLRFLKLIDTFCPLLLLNQSNQLCDKGEKKAADQYRSQMTNIVVMAVAAAADFPKKDSENVKIVRFTSYKKCRSRWYMLEDLKDHHISVAVVVTVAAAVVATFSVVVEAKMIAEETTFYFFFTFSLSQTVNHQYHHHHYYHHFRYRNWLFFACQVLSLFLPLLICLVCGGGSLVALQLKKCLLSDSLILICPI